MTAIWLGQYLPALIPIIDKVAHSFGICLGH
jgi:hypothetical protein